MGPPALLTAAEKAAWRTCPVDRYGEQGVATFRAYLSSVAAARIADDHLPPTPTVDSDCDGPETP